MPSTIVQVPFTGGPKQSVADEYLDPNAQLLDVINGVYTKDGAVDKRLGVAPLTKGQEPTTGAPNIGPAIKVLANGSAPLLTDGDALFSYSPGTPPGWTWVNLISQCNATRTALLDVPSSYVAFSMAEGGGRRAIVARLDELDPDSGSVYLWIQDIATGAWLNLIEVDTSRDLNPKVIFEAGYFVLFWLTTSTTTLWGAVYDGAGNLVTSATALQTTVSGYYDATPEAGGNTPGILVMFALATAGSTSSPAYFRLESLPAFTQSSTGLLANYASTGNVVSCLACRYDGVLGSVWFTWETNNSGTYSLYAQAYTTSWGSVAAAVTVTTIPNQSSSNTARMLCIEPLANGGTAATTYALIVAHTAGPPAQTITSATSAGVAGAAQYGACVRTLSRPFRVTVGNYTRCFFVVQVTQTNTGASGATVPAFSEGFSSTLLVDTMALGSFGLASSSVIPRVVSVLAPRESSSNFVPHQLADSSPGVTTGFLPTQTAVRGLIGTQGYEDFGQNTGLTPSMGVTLAEFDFASSVSMSYADGQGEVFIGNGGVVSYYDSLTFQELGFFTWPIVDSFTQTTGGTLTANGVYEYALCWAQMDNAGQIHRSAFWQDQVTLTGSNDAVTITVETLAFSQRFSGLRFPYLEVYRSVAGQTTLYLIAAIPALQQTVSSGTVFTYTDTTGDASITSNVLQPTTGGVLDSVCPPAPRHIIRHVDRLWTIDDTGLVVWYTTQFNESDAPYFNESLTLQFTEEPLTALASLDDKLVVFSNRSIWYVEGYGPPVTGLGSDLTTAVRVPTDTGVADWRSVVTLPGQGVFFQSALNGMVYLLDRGLGITCVGYAVRDWFTAGPSQLAAAVLAASQLPQTNRVRFVLSSGYCADYDYVQQRWSRQQYPTAPVSATVPVGGAWTYAGTNGRVYVENSGNATTPYFDTLSTGRPQWIQTTIKAAHFKPGGLQGWASIDFVQGLARGLDPFDLNMTLTYDYGTVNESRYYSWANLSTGTPTAPAIVQWRAAPDAASGESMAVQITLSDAAPTGGTATTGQGGRYLGLAFKVTPIGDVYDKLGVGVVQ